MLAVVVGAEHALVGEDTAHAARRGENTSGSVQVPRHESGQGQRGIDIAHLLRAQIELVDTPAKDDVRIVRIGRDVVAFAAGRDLSELAHGDAVAELPRLGRADRAGILLRAINPVRKAVVGADVINLRGRLVVP